MSGANEDAIRKAAALVLAERYRTIGVPAKLLERVLRESGLPLEEALKELEERLNAVGVVIRKVKVVKGTRVFEKYVAVIDPEIRLPEIRPFDPETAGILALIYARSRGEEVPMDELLRDVIKFVGDEKLAKKLLVSSVRKLADMGILRVDSEKGVLRLTEVGIALRPPSDLLDKVIIEALSEGR